MSAFSYQNDSYDADFQTNRATKDTVFCDMFSRKEYLIDLYRALHPEDNTTQADDLKVVTMERVITTGMYNDLGFIAGNRLLVLVEAQSTWSNNIAMRIFLYAAETYRRHIEEMNISLHSTRAFEIPSPEFFVVYTGNQKVPKEISLKHDFFHNDNGFLDLTVRVLTGGGSDMVGQYVEFSKIFDSLTVQKGNPAWKARELVETCLRKGILVPYLRERRKEVTSMMFTLFDQDREMELYHKELREEAMTLGLEEGRAKGLEEGRAKGLEEGRAKGLEEGRVEGRAEGRAEAYSEAAARLAEKMNISIEDAFGLLGIATA